MLLLDTSFAAALPLSYTRTRRCPLLRAGAARHHQALHHQQDKLMGILWTILIGFIVGLVAKFLMPGRDPAGFIITVLIGIVGSVIATYLGRGLGWYQVGESAGFIAAVIGAMILLFIYRLVTSKRS
jgi:uncharacterized membrane protein YeaQ/YmgE (transglycosylase-associated protein family)